MWDDFAGCFGIVPGRRFIQKFLQSSIHDLLSGWITLMNYVFTKRMTASAVSFPSYLMIFPLR